MSFVPVGTVMMSGCGILTNGKGTRREYGEFNLDELVVSKTATEGISPTYLVMTRVFTVMMSGCGILTNGKGTRRDYGNSTWMNLW